MNKYAKKIIAVVLVLTMAISAFVINSSAAAEVNRVTDAIGSVVDGVETSSDVEETLGVDVKDLIDVIKDIDKGDVDIEALSESISKDDMTAEDIAQAVAGAAENAGAIDVDDVANVVEGLGSSAAKVDVLAEAIKAATNSLDLGVDPDKAAEVLRLLVANIKGGKIEVGTTTVANDVDDNWIGTWSTSMVSGNFSLLNNNIKVSLVDVTARMRVMSSREGDTIRLTLSNLYGTSPLNIGEVTVGYANEKVDKAVELDSLVKVTVGGKTSFTIPAGQVVKTDPIDIHVDACQELMVSMYMKGVNSFNTIGLINGHCYVGLGNQTESYASLANIDLALENLSVGAYEIIPILSNIDVYDEDEDAYSVVIFGDSTTTNTTLKKLAATLKANGITNVGLLLEGIKGNEVLLDGQGTIGNIMGKSAVSRFMADVVKQPGVKKVLIKVGVNDIAHPACASKADEYPDFDVATQTDKIIAGYQEMISMAHAADIDVYFATRTPCKGYTRNILGITGDDISEESWANVIEPIRTQLNDWLRENNGTAFEGLVDLEDMMDPNNYGALVPEYTIDGAHLTDLGCQEFAKRAYPVLFGNYSVTVKPDDMDFTGTESYGGLDADLKSMLALVQKLFNVNNSKQDSSLDLSALTKLLGLIKNGNGNTDGNGMSLDTLKSLIGKINPDASVSNDLLNKVLGLINGANKDGNENGNSEATLSTILNLITGITGKDTGSLDLDIIKDILGEIKGGSESDDKTNSDPSIDMSALVGFLNMLKNGTSSNDFNLDSLKDLLNKINPDNSVDTGLLDKIFSIIDNGGSDKNNALDLGTLETILGSLGVGTDDKDALQNVLDKLLGDKSNDDPINLGDLGSNIDLESWIESILGGNYSDPSDPADPESGSTSDDTNSNFAPVDPVLDEYTQETLKDVEIIEGIIMADESTPLTAAVLDDSDLESADIIANTGDAGLVAIASVSMAVGAAFVTSLKKKNR